MRIFVTVVLCLLGFSAVVDAAPHLCAAPVAAKLAQLKVTPAQITNVDYFEIRDNACCEQFDSYEAWVSLKQCRGNVVLKLSLLCEIDETYAHGACDLADLK